MTDDWIELNGIEDVARAKVEEWDELLGRRHAVRLYCGGKWKITPLKVIRLKLLLKKTFPWKKKAKK